jgi:hypothetical protein
MAGLTDDDEHTPPQSPRMKGIVQALVREVKKHTEPGHKGNHKAPPHKRKENTHKAPSLLLLFLFFLLFFFFSAVTFF